MIWARNKIFYSDRILAPFVSILALLIVVSRVLWEDPATLSLILKARMADLALVYLLLAGIGLFSGVKFIVSVKMSALIIAMFTIAVWAGDTSASAGYTASAAGDQLQTTIFAWIGFVLFNVVMVRRLELQDRRDFLLTRRLAEDNVSINMEMQALELFSTSVSGGDSQSKVTPEQAAAVAAYRISSKDITIKEIIGSGSFCNCHKGIFKATSVAVKVLQGSLEAETMGAFGQEAAMMAKLRHKNIVLFMGVCFYPLMVVMELCARGSLYDLIFVKSAKLDWSLLIRVILDAAKGMSYLHGQTPALLHLDLKTPNFLIDDDWRCKIADFGVSGLKKDIVVTENEGKDNGDDKKSDKPDAKDAAAGAGAGKGKSPVHDMGNFVGSMPWIAPEIFKGEQETEKSDVYSFGVCLYELLSKSRPYAEQAIESICFLVSKGKRPLDFNNKLDSTPNIEMLYSTMINCWDQEPKKRPTFERIVEELVTEVIPCFFGPQSADKQWNDKILLPNAVQVAGDSEGVRSSDFSLSGDDLVFGPKIGTGSYGTVYEGTLHGTHVAIKQLHMGALANATVVLFKKECDVMCKMRHPCLVLYMGCCFKPPSVLMLVTELMPLGSLFDLYQSYPKPDTKKKHDSRCARIASEICSGMAYLHAQSPALLHRDLKSQNIWLGQNWNAKVGDFGLARMKDESKTMTKCGSPLWAAPEVLRGERYDEGCDVYSFAVIFWECIAWEEPYKNIKSGAEVMRYVATHGLRPTIPSNCPEEFTEILNSCWHEESNKRNSFENVLMLLDQAQSNLELTETDEQ